MAQLPELVDRLRHFYGILPTPPGDPFILFVWEVLSAHSTPRKRDAALGALRRLRALTPDALWRAPQKKLEESVALAGPYLEQRLRALRTGAGVFRRHPDLPAKIRGPLVAARRALKELPQMGGGGAYRMLLFAADHVVLPVDARVARVARRLGIGETRGRRGGESRARGEGGAREVGSADLQVRPEDRRVRAALERRLPRHADEYRRVFVYLDHHGATTCTEGDPHCAVCPLLDVCPEGRRRASGIRNWE